MTSPEVEAEVAAAAAGTAWKARVTTTTAAAGGRQSAEMLSVRRARLEGRQTVYWLPLPSTSLSPASETAAGAAGCGD